MNNRIAYALEMLDHEARHQHRSSKEHARRAANTTDLVIKDDLTSTAAACLQRARECDLAIKILVEWIKAK